jgi:hypothetical protein
MRALSIRQPFAELILRGMKTVEYRSRPTRIIGEPFWIYAPKGWGLRAAGSGTIWSRDLATPNDPLPPWMLELAEALELWKPGDLPTGVIVGSALIEKCTQSNGHFEWHLDKVKRLPHPRQPTGLPQPVWFKPF